MGLQTDHAPGWQTRFAATRQTGATLDTYERPVAADVIRCKSMELAYKQLRKDRVDAHNTRGRRERISGKWECSWKVSKHVTFSGAAGTPSDAHQFLRAMTGAYTNTPGVSDVYAPSNTQGALGALTLTRWTLPWMVSGVGCVVSEGKLTVPGDGEPMWEFSGPFSRPRWTGRSAVVTGATGVNIPAITASTGSSYMADSIISVGARDNGGLGYRVTSRAGDALAVTPALTSVAAEVIRPWLPAEPGTGAHLGAARSNLIGALTLDGVALPMLNFELSWKNNIKLFTDEAFAASARDYVEGWRLVEGSFSVRITTEQARWMGARGDFGTWDLQLVVGAGAGTTLTVDVDRAELDFGAESFPEGEAEATVEVPFIALESAAGGSECVFTFA